MIDPLIEALIPGFAIETEELCEQVARDLLDLERASDPGQATPLVDRIARGLHTLKGTSATVGLEELASLAHRMEDLIAPVRTHPGPLPPPHVDALLRCLDAFLDRARQRAAGDLTPLPLEDLLAHIALAESYSDGVGDAQAGSTPTSGSAPTVEPEHAHSSSPSSPSAPAPDSATSTDEAPNEAAPRESGAKDESSWRIRSRDLLALVHELERLRELRLRLEQRSRVLAALLPQLRGAEKAHVRDAVARVRRGLVSDADEARDIVDGAETALKAVATVPMRTLLEPLRRAVRDVGRMVGTEAQLSLVGGELGIDRQVLDNLRGALLHLVRNAIDHGIESPEARMRAGKHREGAIVVRAEQQGNLLFLSVEDDGRGLDTERIRERARERGLLQELGDASTAAIHDLVFSPGFSTARDITSASGRGVGLDVVRAEVEALDGTVEVESRPGQGCRFVIVLPVELGSSPLLLVRAGEHRLGIPVLAIAAVRGLRGAEISGTRSGSPRLLLDGERFPLRRMGALLALESDRVPTDEQTILLVNSQGHRAAIAVDEILGDRELMVRALPTELRTLDAYQGAAMLADGELMPVLRPDWLVRQADATAEAGTRAAREHRRRALVVDDSLTARAMHRTMLEAGGFVVHTAQGGREALERLSSARYDVVVCDIGMADMDGYALTERLRMRQELRDLPVILVSARDGQADRQRGFDAGADAFLSKRECESGRLVTEALGVMARRRSST